MRERTRFRAFAAAVALFVCHEFVASAATELLPLHKNPQPDEFLTRWMVCGPFPALNTGQAAPAVRPHRAAFTNDYLGEHGGETNIRPTLAMTHHLDGREYQWHALPIEKKVVDLMTVFGEGTNVAAYGWTEIEMSSPTNAKLAVGNMGAVKVWLNGELIYTNLEYRAVDADEDFIPIRFREGTNGLLVKVCGRRYCSFGCRLVGAEMETGALFNSVSGSGSDYSKVRALLEQMDKNLSADPEQFTRSVALSKTRSYTFRQIDNPLPPALRHRLGVVANRISEMANSVPSSSRADAHYLAARFHYAAGQSEKAISACRECLRIDTDAGNVSSLRARSLLADIQFRGSNKRDNPPVDEFVRAEMASQHIPGLELGVIRDNKVIIAKGYGLANVEDSLPATKETLFQICSMTKSFTATGIMMLVEDGKISLNDPITKWLPELPAQLGTVRIRHLLTHTSGIKDIFEDIYDTINSPEKLGLVRPNFRAESEPGAKFSYNNTGYHLLGLIIQSASGKSYGEFLDERIFRPLGMKITPSKEPRLPNSIRARGYSWEIDAPKFSSKGKGNWATGAGGFASSISDLIKWNAALNSERLLKKSSLEQMWTQGTLNSGKRITHGFGWSVGKVIGHAGGDIGWQSIFVRWPENQDKNDPLSVIVLSNLERTHTGYLQETIARYYLSPPKTQQKEDATTERLKRVLLALIDGKTDAAQFSKEALEELNPEVEEASKFYRMFGPLR